MSPDQLLDSPPAPLGHLVGSGVVTLVEGSSFCVCTNSGDVEPDLPHGVFFADTRIISRWALRVDESPVEALTVIMHQPYSSTFLGRANPREGRVDSTLLVRRDRLVGNGLREDLSLHNHGTEATACTLTLAVEADFADLFEVKAHRVSQRGEHESRVDAGELHLRYRWRDQSRGVVVSAPDAVVGPGLLTFRLVVPAHGVWRASVTVQPIVDGQRTEPRYPLDRPLEEAVPALRLERWRQSAPIVRTDHAGFDAALHRSQQDLGALRIFDPDQPDVAVVAAGAPWFMTLFGRDSILTSYLALPMDQQLALGTLQTLARLQGSKVDAATEEEPGRILHEMRFGVAAGLGFGARNIYYGTIDATPLFVMLLGELRRWGLARDEVDALLPHADRALEWIERYGDRDGDGFVEYQRATDRGIFNQGWKDSGDGILHLDGRVAEPPVALCEVQGYAYAAFVARAHFATEEGDAPATAYWSEKAAALKRAFNERFWLPERGWYALGLDRDKRPIESLASNMGHCLWTGIIDEDKAPAVAERLLSPELFSGWGVRTLASSMSAYNPMSYHNGSVWPHDNAIVAAGLMRYGFVAAAQRVALGLLEASTHFVGRLPELFCGFSAEEYPPVPYPTSCSPQAWAAATPVHLLRTFLRLDPWVPYGRVWLAPALPVELGDLRVENLSLAGRRVVVTVTAGQLEVDGLPDDITLMREPRLPTSGVVGPAPEAAEAAGG